MIKASKQTRSNLVLRLLIDMLLRPMRILNVRDLKESIRVGAADPQSRADAFAVLLLALDADDLGLVLLPRFGPVEEKCLLVTRFGVRRYPRWLGNLQLVDGLVWVFACCGHAGEDGHDDHEDGEVLHFSGWFGLVWFSSRVVGSRDCWLVRF